MRLFCYTAYKSVCVPVRQECFSLSLELRNTIY